jgi:hypothetical protein
MRAQGGTGGDGHAADNAATAATPQLNEMSRNTGGHMQASARPRPFRLTPTVTPEDALHESVADALDVLVLPPAVWTTFPAGNVPLEPRYAAKLARLGLKRGWPDILVLHQTLFGVELKRAGGALSRTRMVRARSGGLRVLEGQADVFPRLIAAGMRIAVCRSVDEVVAALRGWGVPLRVAA